MLVEGVFGRRVWRETDDFGDPETRQWDQLENKPDSSATCQQKCAIEGVRGALAGSCRLPYRHVQQTPPQ
jgi:hypothetical protein